MITYLFENKREFLVIGQKTLQQFTSESPTIFTHLTSRLQQIKRLRTNDNNGHLSIENTKNHPPKSPQNKKNYKIKI
jgi:hypothetical protein